MSVPLDSCGLRSVLSASFLSSVLRQVNCLKERAPGLWGIPSTVLSESDQDSGDRSNAATSRRVGKLCAVNAKLPLGPAEASSELQACRAFPTGVLSDLFSSTVQVGVLARPIGRAKHAFVSPLRT